MKLSPLTVYVMTICVVFLAAMVTLTYFLPNMEEARYQNTLANELIEQANLQPQANKKVEQAIADVNKMAEQWETVVNAKTPPDHLPSGINLAVNRWQLTNDSVTFRNSIQRAVNAQMKKGGVTIVQGANIPPPPADANQIVEYYNYPAIRFPVLIFDLGQITVQGTYSQIMENVRSWANMPNYLAVADGLQLSGTSPNMTGTYSVSIVAYIRGDVVAGPVPEGAGGGQAGGITGPTSGPGPGRGPQKASAKG